MRAEALLGGTAAVEAEARRTGVVAEVLRTRALLPSGGSNDNGTVTTVRLDEYAAILDGAATDLAQMLLDAGAFVDAPDAQGNTPLHAALHHGPCRGVAYALLAHGAYIFQRNGHALTPFQVALGTGNAPLAKTLLKNMALREGRATLPRSGYSITNLTSSVARAGSAVMPADALKFFGCALQRTRRLVRMAALTIDCCRVYSDLPLQPSPRRLSTTVAAIAGAEHLNEFTVEAAARIHALASHGDTVSSHEALGGPLAQASAQ
eukprot:scaffold2879_cov269-Prasinococcus_capsulatus_cf.AAC.30